MAAVPTQPFADGNRFDFAMRVFEDSTQIVGYPQYDAIEFTALR
jgi:hypothetical protein